MMPPNHSLITRLTCLAVACSSYTTNAFSSSGVIINRNHQLTKTSTSTSITQYASLAPEELERSENNPSTKFGSPISEGLKDANRFTIGFLKGAVFDTVFAGEGREFARFYALETIAREFFNTSIHSIALLHCMLIYTHVLNHVGFILLLFRCSLLFIPQCFAPVSASEWCIMLYIFLCLDRILCIYSYVLQYISPL